MVKGIHWDQGAETWDEMIHDESSPHYHYYRTIDMLVVQLLRDVQARRALELGCGTAECSLYVLRILEDMKDLHIVGVDSSAKMIEIAQRKAKAAGVTERITLKVKEATQLSYPEEHFDAIFSRGAILSYLKRPHKLLRAAHSALKEEGVIGLDVLPQPPEGRDYHIFRSPEIQLTRSKSQSDTSFITVHEVFTRGKYQIVRRYRVQRDTQLYNELKQSFQNLPSHLPGLIEPPKLLLQATVMTEERVRLYTVPEITHAFQKAGFDVTKIYGAGYTLRLLKDEEIRSFVNKHRDIFCRIEILLNALFNLQYATMLFITGRKKSAT